ncbi:MAG: glycosyltransferase family A protein [Patescibacteria group bacterium]
MPKIILVTLVHNRKHLVGLSLQSAINQSLPKDKWVHLVIDNKSSDGADLVCDAFKKKCTNMFFIKMNENIGQQKAYNFVLNEWLPNNYKDAGLFCVLDSDDMLAPNALSEADNMFNTHPEVGQTYSGFSIIDKKNRVVVKNHAKAKLVQNQFTVEGQKQLRKIFISQNPIGHMRCFNIPCLRDIGGFNTQYQYATDYNIAGRMLMRHPVVKIDKVLYLWRQHDQQVERQHSPQQTKDWQDMQKEFKEIFTKEGLI